MKLMNMDDKLDKLLKIMIALSSTSCVLFVSVIGVNIYSSEILPEKFEVNVLKGLVFILNLISYQNFLVMYILAVLVAYVQVRCVVEYLEKFSKPQNENSKIKRSELRSVSDIIDRICDCVDTLGCPFLFWQNTGFSDFQAKKYGF
jgi:hypothetical protein